MRTILLSATLAFLISPALAQERDLTAPDRDEVILTLPDGSTETIVLTGDEVIRLVVRNGNVEVIRRDATGDRRAIVLAPRDEGDAEVTDIEFGTILDRLPQIVRERLEEVTLPRVRLEVEGPSELRREVAAAERASRRLALELRRAERDGNRAEAERLRAELTRVLDESFDLRQAERRARVDALRERQARIAEEAAELESETELRERRRSEIIERRLEELTLDREALDW